jgi:hypothetical protein
LPLCKATLEKKAVITDFVKSASSKMIFADFPPNSNVAGFNVGANAARMALAVAPPPVNEILSTASWVTSQAGRSLHKEHATNN